MAPVPAAVLQALALIALLVLTHRPLGAYMARVFTSSRDLAVERGVYRLIGVSSDAAQSWRMYLRALLAFSLVSVVVVYALQRVQQWLPASLGLPAVPEPIAFNTAASFVANTNWQSYTPETTVGWVVQAGGLAVQNFVSAAVGIAVAVALVRGFAARGSGAIGNFWVDLVRGTFRILLPISVVGAIILISGGTIQNLVETTTVHTLAGGTQTIPGGPVASQEVIKLLGTNGGGFFNANSAHPFENPTPWTNVFEAFLILLIPFALPRTFGLMVGDKRQGYAIAAAMGTIFLVSLVVLSAFEHAGSGPATDLAGAAMEGKEVRFGVFGTTLFGTASTLTSTGAVNGMHDSFTALGGMMPMLNMMLGEIAPGGVGSGLYGMLVIAVIAVFVGGLLIGRTPEYLGKRLGPREITLASLYILVVPTLVLAGTALSFAIPGVRESLVGTSILNPGNHGLSEVLYAYTSAANNNGSAFAGLTASTPWFATTLGIAMLVGRFVPIVFVIALAGALARQTPAPASVGTLPTHRPLFVGLLTGVAVIITALTYFPVLALGPLAEGLA